MEGLQDLFNAWDREYIMDCLFIYCLIVLYWAKASILLLNKEPRARPWGVGWFNISQLQIFHNELLGSFLLILVQYKDLAVDQRGCTFP
jgi:hypothetical protein